MLPFLYLCLLVSLATCYLVLLVAYSGLWQLWVEPAIQGMVDAILAFPCDQETWASRCHRETAAAIDAAIDEIMERCWDECEE